MLKSQDILVLLELATRGGERTVRSIGAELELDPASVHRSLKRLADARLWIPSPGVLVRGNARELLVHGVKYFFPVVLGGPTPGTPTAWSAPPLAGRLAESDERAVWPDPMGSVRGLAVTPLHAAVPAIARRRPDLAELLALIDGIRLGDARVRSLAIEELDLRIGSGGSEA